MTELTPQQQLMIALINVKEVIINKINDIINTHNNDTSAHSITIEKQGTPDANNSITYLLKQNNEKKGTSINIPTGNDSQAGILKLGITNSTAAKGSHTHDNYIPNNTDGSTTGNITATTSGKGIITANQFKKNGGNSNQFLKADGSVDEHSYLTTHQSLSDIGGVVDVIKQQSAEGSNFATYVIKQNGTQVGEKINIPKDFVVKSGQVKTASASPSSTLINAGVGANEKYISLIINTADNNTTTGNTELIIPAKDLIETTVTFSQTQQNGTNSYEIGKITIDGVTTTIYGKEFKPAIDGGVNLLPNTQSFEPTNFFIGESTINDIYNNCNVRYIENNASDNVDFKWIVAKEELEPNAYYTLSFWAKTTSEHNKLKTFFYGGNNTVGSSQQTPNAKRVESNSNDSTQIAAGNFGDGNTNIKPTTSWKRYYIVYQLNSTEPTYNKTVCIRLQPSDNSNASDADAYIAGVKFERGNKPTEWSPSPDDYTKMYNHNTYGTNIDYNTYYGNEMIGKYQIWWGDQQNNEHRPTDKGGLLVVQSIPNGFSQTFYCYDKNNNAEVYYRTIYTYNEVTCGNWVKIITDNDFTDVNNVVTKVKALKLFDPILTKSGTSGTVTFTLKNKLGDPIVNATIYMHSPRGYGAPTTTNSQGQVTFNLPYEFGTDSGQPIYATEAVFKGDSIYNEASVSLS